MRRLTAALLIFLSAGSIGISVFSPDSRAAGPISAKDRLVVVISLDGFPAYSFRDPALPTPTLRRLAREGAMAEGMRVSNPSVTWPNHTSLVTGVQPERHGVLFNGLLVRGAIKEPPKVQPWRDKAEMVRVPTVYDLAYKAGLTTAQVNWVAIQNPGTITWEFPERPKMQGIIEKEMISKGLLTEEEVKDFNQTVITWRDQAWTNAAIHIIQEHKPNLLLFHLLNLDSIHHRYGPKTLAGFTTQAYVDSNVQRILDAIKTAGILDRTTILVVSDHGFKTAKRTILANAALRQQMLLHGDGDQVMGDAYVVPEGGIAMAYVLDPENRTRLVPRMKEIFMALEGVARVLEPVDFHSLGMPIPDENTQMADLVLVAKDGYSFSGASTGDPVIDIVEGINPGNHGYVSTDPEMNAIFIAWGYGIQRGQRLPLINNVDVAPTIAALLGLNMEGIAGRVLDTILKLP